MKNVINYSEFGKNFIVEKIEPENVEALNEGLFDMLRNMFTKLFALFKDPVKLNDQQDSAAKRLGTKAENSPSRTIKLGTTVMVKLISPEDETVKMIISFTKLADMPDGSGLFQMTGTDSANFLKSLTIKDNAALNAIGILAIIDPKGFVKGESVTMRMYKNVSKDGKPIVTANVVQSAIGADELAKETTTKPAAAATPAPTPGGQPAV